MAANASENRASKIVPSEATSLNVTAPGAVLIPAGRYAPNLRAATDPVEVAVGSFLLDKLPVTNAQFLAFVTPSPNGGARR